MQDQRLMEHLAPVVEHMRREHAAGAPVEHVLWEAVIAAAYVGMGWHPVDALRRAEALEARRVFPTAAEEPAWLQRFERERLGYPTRYPMRYPGEEYA